MKSLMGMMVGSCEKSRALFSAHLEDELKGMRHVRLRFHLTGCSACSAIARSLQATVDRLHELGEDAFAPPQTGSVVPAVVERIRRFGDE